jgi:trk system potassium uptake protein
MRHRAHLIQRYKALLGYTGQITIILGGLNLVPLLLLIFYPQEINLAGGFLLAGLPLVILGALAWRYLVPQEPVSLSVPEGMVVVTLVWIIALVSAAIPFMTANGMTFTQAMFESTSGWTGTGLTVVDIPNTSQVVHFHRAFTQLAGGAGIAIIVLSAVAGGIGAGLSTAEGRTDQLAPHIRRSATIVMSIYTGYTIAGILALRIVGMGWFDSTIHAFTALGTGGFSTRVESAGYWDSALIEGVLIVLMLLGGTNFFIAYTAFRGKWRPVIRSGEVRLMVVLIVLAVLVLLLVMTPQLYATAEKSLRVAVFESVSAITTSGLATVDYRAWPDIGWLVLIVLMLIGGGVGSTSGGLKLMRAYILYKAVIWEIKRAFMPPHMVNEPAIWTGDKRELLNDKQVRQTALYAGLYIAIFVTGSLIFVAFGFPLRESMFEFASALATTGVTGGVTSPTLHPFLLWVQIAGMLLGRLEFFAIIVGFLKIGSDAWSIFYPESR